MVAKEWSGGNERVGSDEGEELGEAMRRIGVDVGAGVVLGLGEGWGRMVFGVVRSEGSGASRARVPVEVSWQK
jgi:hypothetical protein